MGNEVLPSLEKKCFNCTSAIKSRHAEHLWKKIDVCSISKGIIVHEVYLWHLPLWGSSLQWTLYLLYLFFFAFFFKLCIVFHVPKKIINQLTSKLFCFTPLVCPPGYMSSPPHPDSLMKVNKLRHYSRNITLFNLSFIVAMHLLTT